MSTLKLHPVHRFKDKSIKDRYCLSPFVSLRVNTTGDVGLCGCMGWMPTTIGNILTDKLQELLQSNISKDIRQSIIDGSYQFCNETTCGVLQNNQLNDIKNVPDDVAPLLESSERFIMPREIFLAGDKTCNLSCPSCRTSVIKIDEHDRNRQAQLGKILKNNLLSVPTDARINITVSTSGEVFASSMLQSFLSSINIVEFPNLTIDLQTNGLLCSKKWHTLGQIVSRIRKITVTIDATTKEVYEVLRRGGIWEDLLKEMKYLQEKKQEIGFALHTRMVVQKTNKHQIVDFYDLSKSFSADQVEYTRILDFGSFTASELKDADVFDITHTEYSNSQTMLNALSTKSDVFLSGGLSFTQ